MNRRKREAERVAAEESAKAATKHEALQRQFGLVYDSDSGHHHFIPVDHDDLPLWMQWTSQTAGWRDLKVMTCEGCGAYVGI